MTTAKKIAPAGIRYMWFGRGTRASVPVLACLHAFAGNFTQQQSDTRDVTSGAVLTPSTLEETFMQDN